MPYSEIGEENFFLEMLAYEPGVMNQSAHVQRKGICFFSSSIVHTAFDPLSIPRHPRF